MQTARGPWRVCGLLWKERDFVRASVRARRHCAREVAHGDDEEEEEEGRKKRRRRQRGCDDDDIENSVLQFRGERSVCGLVTRSGGRVACGVHTTVVVCLVRSCLSPPQSNLSLSPLRRYQRRHPLISLTTPPFFIFSLLKRQMDKVYCKVGSAPGQDSQRRKNVRVKRMEGWFWC